MPLGRVKKNYTKALRWEEAYTLGVEREGRSTQVQR